MLRIYFSVSLIIVGATATQAKAVTVWGVDGNNRTGGDSVVKFDSANPVSTIVSIGHTGVTGSFMSGLDFDAGGTLYACSQSQTDTGSFYKIDQTNGHATLIGAMNLAGTNQEMIDLTYNPVTHQFLGTAFDGTNNFLYTIDKTSGATTLVGQLNSPNSILYAISTDSTGQVYFEGAAGVRMGKLNGLTVTPMSGVIGVPIWFSQGMTMDWSNGDAWYLADWYQAVPNTFKSRGDFRLMNNTTGATQQILGEWPLLPEDQFGQSPVYSIGDIAIKPIPELSAAVAGFAMSVGAMTLRRRR